MLVLFKRMDLEIKDIYSDDLGRDELPEDLYNFNIPLRVEIGEKGKEGAEVFHFVAASPLGLQDEVAEREFKLLRGYILMVKFDWRVVHRAVENVINHARSRNSWAEVVEFFNRYSRYDSEDLGR